MLNTSNTFTSVNNFVPTSNMYESDGIKMCGTGIAFLSSSNPSHDANAGIGASDGNLHITTHSLASGTHNIIVDTGYNYGGTFVLNAASTIINSGDIQFYTDGDYYESNPVCVSMPKPEADDTLALLGDLTWGNISGKPTIYGSGTETWTFTLSDNTTVTKTVVVG